MPQSSPFGERLADAVRGRASVACVGIDPRLGWLPEDLTGAADGDAGRALTLYGEAVIEAIGARAPAVKLNTAFFERHGVPGWTALLALARRARERGLVVIADAKRADIGPTAEAYAEAFLGEDAPFDALTVLPWMGTEGLTPFVQTAVRNGRGIFVVLRSSNPSAAVLQEATAADGKPLWEHIAAELTAMDGGNAPGAPGPIGAVVGATFPEAVARARAALPDGWLLLPGYGAQGGGADAVARALRPDGLGALVNASRSVGFPWRAEGEERAPADWRDRIAAALDRMNADLRPAVESVRDRASPEGGEPSR